VQRKEPTIGSFDTGYAPPASRVDSGEPLNAPRKPWLALLTGLLAPPVAFAYAGRPVWALGWFPAIIALMVLAGQTGFLQSVAGAWTFMGASVAAVIGCIVLPWWFARAGARRYRLRWFNRWYVYAALGIAFGLPGNYHLAHKHEFLGFDTYRIPSGSMIPTLMIGDFVMADTRPHAVAALHPGDVAIYRSRSRPEQSFVKRIVAGPGQHVQIDQAGLKVDGKLQSHLHAQGNDWTQADWLKHSDVVLSADEFYLMGDNRSNSYDSRTEGPVHREELLAKPTTIYYALDAARIGPIE